MATEALISWNAPAHFYVEKRQDWYWAVGIVTLAITAVCIIFGQIITGIFVIVAAVALVLHVPVRLVAYHARSMTAALS